jgi:hypothetical protein
MSMSRERRRAKRWRPQIDRPTVRAQLRVAVTLERVAYADSWKSWFDERLDSAAPSAVAAR